MSRIGFVGLGAMGGRMARRLIDAGHELVVWNRNGAKASPLVRLGATLTETPAEAARDAGVVFTMVTDEAALAAVTEGPHGALAGVGPDAVVVQTSTVGLSAVARLAIALPKGAGVVDAPVLGSIAEAEAGTLQIFASGDAALIERVAPLLATLGTVTNVGPLGAGQAAKLVANSTLFGMLGVLGEALALARTLGLADDATFRVLGATPLAAQAERRRPAIESGAYPPRFTLALALKDAELVLGAARANELRLPVAEAARAWLADAQSAGRGGEDYSVVLQRILSQSG